MVQMSVPRKDHFNKLFVNVCFTLVSNVSADTSKIDSPVSNFPKLILNVYEKYKKW